MKLGASGALLPERGFTRHRPPQPIPPGQSAWRSHDGLLVVSSLEQSHLPGSGDPPKIGPQWLVTVSRPPRWNPPTDLRCSVTNADVARVAECFAMPAFDEDNHHPGVARHLWCPVDARYQQACECKASELTIVEPNGYAWTTEPDACRGCDYQRRFGLICPRHGDA